VKGFFFSFLIRFYASQSVTEGSESTPTRERERERERQEKTTPQIVKP
jgi:hypothetical protein